MFKKGDKVRRIQGCHEEMKVGDVAIVEGYDKYDDKFLRLCGYGTCHSADNFELISPAKEDTSVWLKENAWYTRVSNEDEFNLVKDWLNDRNVRFLYKSEWENIYVAVGSDGWRTDSCIRLCKGEEGLDDRQELKPQFKLTLEGIMLPEPPKKTEQQLKLEQLEATIQKAQQEIQKASAEVQALKEMK